MDWQKRNFLLGTAFIAYVAFASMRASGRPSGGALALVLLPLLLAFAWSRTQPPRRGEDPVDPTVRRATRAGLWGASILLASRTSFLDEPSLNAAANLGTGVAATSALVALARIAVGGGSLPLPPAARKLDAAWLVALTWAGASSLSLLAVIEPALGIEARHEELLTTVAGIVSLLVIFLSIVRSHLLRQLELGAGDRTRAALSTVVIASFVATAVALFRLSPPDWAFQAGTTVTALLLAMACLARDPVTVARTHRLLVVVAVAGAPLTLLATSIALRASSLAPLAVLFTALACVTIGLLARHAIQPIERERARWLEAIEKASAEALLPSPDRAIVGALTSLRDAAGPAEIAPSLWRLMPAGVLHTDHAGYLHVRPGAVPPSVLTAAMEEPERTLRLEVLEALEVRRPDLRQALQWMRDEEAMTATLLRLDDDIAGVLLLPRGRRTMPLTLEEARALRLLTDRLASALETSSALARSRERELAERARADAEEERVQRLEYLLDTAGARYETDARRLAREALSAAYSPASRLVLDELSRLGALSMPTALVAPLGTDPVAYAAVFHLSGSRRDKPFVVVDAANPQEQPLAVWQDPVASPLAIADSGTLVVTSIEALPHDTQDYLARTLATRRSPSGRATPLDLGLVVSVIEPVERLAASERLVPKLADRLTRTLSLPSLAMRPEDLRALSLDRLARIGVRLRGKPMGLDARAMALVVEHSWPGNELELTDVLSRAAQVASRDVITGADLERIGFVPLSESEPAVVNG